MPTQLEPARLLVNPHVRYTARLARNADEVRAAQALRFAVFNLELNEGLAESHASGLDADPFDDVCDHLVVEHLPQGEIVGTYRLQTGPTAAANRGFYSEQEFDFRPYEPIRGELIELGRACVHPLHRNLVVLGLLWKGIAQYAQQRGGRYLCGCSSITSQDPLVGASAYSELYRRHLAPPQWRTQPLPAFDCPLSQLSVEAPKIPKLLRAYLALGAKNLRPASARPPVQDHRFPDAARLAGVAGAGAGTVLELNLPMNRASQIRRTNDEIRRTKSANAQLKPFPHSGFGFLSSFFILHSSFRLAALRGPNSCGVELQSIRHPFLRQPFRVTGRLAWLMAEFVLGALAYVVQVAFRQGNSRHVVRDRWLHQTCRRVLRVLSVKLEVSGPVPARGLLVCNHVSYLDILLIGAVAPARFVAKHEVRR